MSVSTNEFQRGIVLGINGEPWQILEFHFVNPGKGSAFTRVNLKNLKTGKVVEKTFKSGESFEEIEMEYKHAKFLYKDRKNAVFAIGEAKERLSFPLGQLEWELNFLKENTEIDIMYLGEEPFGVKLPAKVDLKVVEAPPNIKGNTATGGRKTVVVETGYNVIAPIFIEEDDVISINTQTGEYSGKVGA